MRPAVLGLVADDLTGAGDAAVGFVGAGWRAVLALGPGSWQADGAALRPTVVAVSTAARPLDDDAAAVRTRRAVAAAADAGAERLYLKIDSTVRGSVAGQVAGALSAWSERHPGAYAVVCPAFPEHGRTVVDGEVLVDGAPLAGSAAALDPVTPRTSGRLSRLLPGAVRQPPATLAARPGARLVVDAHDDADLDRLARLVDEAGPQLVAVGSGGLTAALGRLWSVPHDRVDGWGDGSGFRGRVLVAVSSRHPASTDQLDQLGRRDDAAGAADVLTTSAATLTPVDAAADLAARVGVALSRQRYAALVVVGGDGVAAVLADLGAESVEVDGALLPGCPTGIVRGGRADGLRLVTKSGGFGTPATLELIVRTLAAPPPPLDHPLAPGTTLEDLP